MIDEEDLPLSVKFLFPVLRQVGIDICEVVEGADKMLTVLVPG